MTYYGDNATQLTGSVIALATIAYITFGLRIYTRIRNGSFGVDDWSMAAATIPFTALTVACIGGAFNGIGIHQFRLDKEHTKTGMQYFFFFEVFYCAAIIPIKLSISFMLIRIASNQVKYTYSLYAVSAMFTTMNLIAMLYIIFHCLPVQYAWDTSIKGGKCNPAQTLADIYYATTAVNIVTDWFCALLPIPLLWNVQLNRNAKLSVGVILGLGALASLSACIRLVYTVNITNTNEYLYGISDVVLWGYAENGIGMIVGCVATLRPLFRRVFSLGGDTAPNNTPGASYARRPAKLRPNGRDEEWVALSDSKMASVVQGRTLPDSSSEEHILGNGIKVTSTVEQDVEVASKR
ncbi:hypothetical protein BU25DRAFT_134871 [Macroventuria anomochaeta]|uniref:Uncharacterized protein n=1 Tax=Macroventuria anomochaeta TaxID=301207 RepID=A0ACB6RS69_9PLEO|nr:uncharacterized protein BU25DRAFT_134871 [Macroventuria anomochaeta]KAF2624830.1 hypothetical protein BU25DRAFT_134871 [Macroventuria anomochaeta]